MIGLYELLGNPTTELMEPPGSWVKRKDDKQYKGSKEKTTNNRKGQKKRGQIMERVKRKEDTQSKGSKEKRKNNRKGQKKRGQTIEGIKKRRQTIQLYMNVHWMVLYKR